MLLFVYNNHCNNYDSLYGPVTCLVYYKGAIGVVLQKSFVMCDCDSFVDKSVISQGCMHLLKII